MPPPPRPATAASAARGPLGCQYAPAGRRAGRREIGPALQQQQAAGIAGMSPALLLALPGSRGTHPVPRIWQLMVLGLSPYRRWLRRGCRRAVHNSQGLWVPSVAAQRAQHVQRDAARRRLQQLRVVLRGHGAEECRGARCWQRRHCAAAAAGSYRDTLLHCPTSRLRAKNRPVCLPHVVVKHLLRPLDAERKHQTVSMRGVWNQAAAQPLLQACAARRARGWAVLPQPMQTSPVWSPSRPAAALQQASAHLGRTRAAPAVRTAPGVTPAAAVPP